MDILLFIGVLIVGGLLNLAIKFKDNAVYNLAIAGICLSLAMALCSWPFYYTSINKIPFFVAVFGFLFQWGGLLWYLILGFLMVNMSVKLRSKDPLFDTYEVKRIIRATLWAISILTGNMFLISSIGKWQNIVYMKGFFTSSGYAIWFLYFIIAAEFLGGLGLLLHFKLKTGPLAAAGLMMIMAGAVYTHVHNKDPFSDAYAALTQFITLTLMQAIYYFERQANNKPAIIPT